MPQSDIYNWIFCYKEMKRKVREEAEEKIRLERKSAILGIEAICNDEKFFEEKERVKITEIVEELNDDEYEYEFESSCTVGIRKKRKIVEE